MEVARALATRVGKGGGGRFAAALRSYFRWRGLETGKDERTFGRGVIIGEEREGVNARILDGEKKKWRRRARSRYVMLGKRDSRSVEELIDRKRLKTQQVLWAGKR